VKLFFVTLGLVGGTHVIGFVPSDNNKLGI
jgi:hypothetical protein